MTTDKTPAAVNPTDHTKLIFLHIPKTAGTTLKRVIERQYGTNEIGKCYYQKRFKTLRDALDRIRALPNEQAELLKIIIGHVGFGIHEHLPWPCTYLTVLRNPIDRVISSYYQTRRGKLDPLRDQAQRLSLKDFVSSGLLKALDNGQARLLSGAAVEEDLLGKATEYGQCKPEMLERAKKHLDEHFAVVGTSERFDESLMLFKRVFGWSSIYYVKANVGLNRARKEELSKDTLRCIEKYNELDMQLYEYAERMLDEALRRQGQVFRRRIDSYRLLNRTYGEARRVLVAIERIAKR